MAGRLAAQRRTPEDIRLLRRIMDDAQTALDEPGAGYPQGAHMDLHATVLSIARNPMLEQRAQETERQLALARYRSAAATDRAAAALAEHEGIVEAITAGRPVAAHRLVMVHIQNSAKRAIRGLDTG